MTNIKRNTIDCNPMPHTTQTYLREYVRILYETIGLKNVRRGILTAKSQLMRGDECNCDQRCKRENKKYVSVCVDLCCKYNIR